MKITIALTIFLLAALRPLAHATVADSTVITVASKAAGATPFTSKVTVNVNQLSDLRRIQFAVTPKSGSVTRPLSASYTKTYLDRRGYLHSDKQQIVVPVFGLYAGYTNDVALTYFFSDGSVKEGSGFDCYAVFRRCLRLQHTYRLYG